MDASSRDEILANFQSFTGIEDIDYCITLLENNQWNLLDAVNVVVPQDFNPVHIVEPIQETNGNETQRNGGEVIDLTMSSNIDLTHERSATAITTTSNGYIREPPHPPPPKQEISIEEDDDSEYDDARDTFSDEGEAITDDMFVNDDDNEDHNNNPSLSREPLIPADCEDILEASQCFNNRFIQRYGDVHPFFYHGPLADAVRESNGSSAAERRPLLIYLHHDQSILSNIFCSQLLCSESIVSYLSLHYVVWAWDLTHENLKRKLLEMVRDCFGLPVAKNVDDIKPDSLPVILIVFKAKGQMDVRNIIQGHTDPDTLLSSLIFAHDEHQAAVEVDLKEERERFLREEMKALQEAAFEESLKVDREKMLKKQQEEEEEIRRQEKIKIERQQMEDSIPPEPPKGSVDKITTLRLRCPDGSTDQRRFLASHTVEMLLNYIGSKGYHPRDYKVLMSFPRNDVTQFDVTLSLEEVKLFPQETLFIEER